MPLAEATSNTAGTVGPVSDPVVHTAAGLLDLTATQPNGFLGTIVGITSPSVGIGDVFDLSFGSDSSLMADPGWDDATGWGVPNGLTSSKPPRRSADVRARPERIRPRPDTRVALGSSSAPPPRRRAVALRP